MRNKLLAPFAGVMPLCGVAGAGPAMAASTTASTTVATQHAAGTSHAIHPMRAESAWNPGGTSVGYTGNSGEETWTYMVPANSATAACAGTQFSVNGSRAASYDLGCYTP